ncbi:MAG TPA: aldehyde dehydrogenase family protein [Candidatus Binatus sp.]|jgi:acyl-CoA reductase-like NAD-dependent aldehyde dehydrogenase|nr:aldehyde dehydrogenase family protein [Candidatus Binatus sp.]
MGVPVFDKVLIGGRWVAAARGSYAVINPATEEPAGYAPECSPEQMRDAARAAREAFDRGPWRRMDGAERGKLLVAAAERFRREAPGLVELTIAETGAVRPVAERLQVGQAGERLARYGELAAEPVEKRLSDIEARAPWGGGVATGLVVREPIGVVACISPFNFPMTNCAGKIGPALAAGNTVVVKPSPQDPLGVAELCRIVDAVLPPGVVNFVCGSGPDIGEALTLAPEVDMISFTGSTAVGRAIQTAVGRQMKRTLQELGGKSANVVFADADLSRALAGSMSVWTFHAGQICTAPTRLLVERSIYAAFTQRLVAAAGSVTVGDPRDAGVVMGPLVSAAQRERVERFIAQGVAEGATLACGGRRPPQLPRGYYVEPTLFTEARNDMVIAREEIFGPVITAIPFRDEEEAIALGNDSEFGLYGYVWSGDHARALRVARGLRTGTVQINGSPPHPEAPFGGYKQSGVGRDGGRWALDTYSELKAIGWLT